MKSKSRLKQINRISQNGTSIVLKLNAKNSSKILELFEDQCLTEAIKETQNDKIFRLAEAIKFL